MTIYVDITYESLAKAFNQKLVHHDETIRRMKEMNKNRKWIGTQNAEQRAATNRMALFPENAEVLFVGEDIWVVRLLAIIMSERQPIYVLSSLSSVSRANCAYSRAFLLSSKRCYTV